MTNRITIRPRSASRRRGEPISKRTAGSIPRRDARPAGSSGTRTTVKPTASRRSGSLAGSGHPGCSCPVAAAPGSACREHQTALFDASRKPAGGGRYGEVHTHRGESRRRPGRPRLPRVGGLWASEARSTGQHEKEVSCGGTVRRKGARVRIIHQHVKADQQSVEVGGHNRPRSTGMDTADFGALSWIPTT